MYVYACRCPAGAVCGGGLVSGVVGEVIIAWGRCRGFKPPVFEEGSSVCVLVIVLWNFGYICVFAVVLISR